MAVAVSWGTPIEAQGVQSPARVEGTVADTIALGLADALRRALRDGEEVKLAADVAADAREQVAAARSGLFPTVNGRVGYTRTIRTPINVGTGFTLPDSLQFRPDSLAPLPERVRYLERNTPNAGLGALSSLFSGLPFGQKNTYVATLSASQTLFDANVFTGLAIAKEFERMVDAQVTEQRLDVALSVIEAYYDAVLADRQADIVVSTMAQLQEQTQQVRLVRAAGNASDLDVLRVEVDLQNVEPQRVAALNQRDVALLNLKRLINLPIAQPIRLTDRLSAADFRAIPAETVAQVVDHALERRAAVTASERQVTLRRQQVTVARNAFLPTVSLSANFGKQALPGQLVPSYHDFRDDWNAGLAVNIPIFSGGQRRADVERARVQLNTSELQLAQLRESVVLDVTQQRGELERASALIRARAQTVSQAERVYSLTNLAYEKGVQTNLQLGDARLQLQQARANEATALHDYYYIALARLLRASGVSESDLQSRATSGGTGR